MRNIFNVAKSNWVILAIVIIAAAFRFWQINSLPGGLFPDEAANGLDVNAILNGDTQPFYERGNGREAGFFYLLAATVAIFGRGPWEHHIVSAGLGFLATVAIYFLTRRMFGRRTALLTTFFMAISSYAVTISRTAFRANLVPLLSILTIFFLVKFFQTQDRRQKYWSAALAGISFGAGFYSYTSFRMMLPLVVGFLLLLFLGFRNQWKKIFSQYAKYKIVFVVCFLAVISWLTVYFIQHPGSLVGRSGQVSIFNVDLNQGNVWGTFFTVLKQTILAFFTQGDLNWRHNISGFPLLSPFLSPFFAAALLFMTIAAFRLLKQVWSKKISPETFYQALVATWFWFMLVPEVTTAEGIPHGLRLIGVIPPMFILSAWGINWFWGKLSTLSFFPPYKKYFAAIFLVGLFVYNFNLYFVVAANSPEYYYAFRSDLTVVSNYLNQRNLKAKTYLSLDKFSVQTVDYLTTENNQPFILLDPAHTYEVTLFPGDQVIFTQSTLFDRLKFIQFHPQARLVSEIKNKFGQIIMLIYQ